MISTVYSFGVRGIAGFLTEVETYITRGIPEFEIIGLGDASVKESKRRVIAALRNQGYEMPSGRITVNLAPSSVRKEGTSFDIAIAAGLLCAAGVYRQEEIRHYAFIGELSLDGSVRPINGIMAMILEGRKKGIRNFIVPKENCQEGALIQGANLYCVETLRQIHTVLQKSMKPSRSTMEGSMGEKDSENLCFSQVRGQEGAKRALEIAASGGHHVLMLGTVGAGKTMLARRFPTILPPLTQEEMYEVASIQSVCGIRLTKQLLQGVPPFREIHAGITKAGLIGGKVPILPGEISLAHRGVLFWDEMGESDSMVLDALRVPLETGEVHISRAGQGEIFPARFQLIGASNPCRCGQLLEGNGTCRCTPVQIQRDISKISRPLLDRIDLQIPVRSLSPEAMEMKAEQFYSETSEDIRARVIHARQIQKERYANEGITLNAYISRNMIEKYCSLSTSARRLMSTASRKLGFSMRAYEKILRIARTIADLNEHTLVEEEDVGEAIQFRQYELEVCTCV